MFRSSVIIVSLSCLAPLTALAEADVAEPEIEAATDRARDAFVRATELARLGRWREALDEYERSAKLRDHAVTTYNIAYCERALGGYARAWGMFGRALQADELPADLAESARIYRSEIESKLARVALRVPPAATLTVDGEPVALVSEGLAVAGMQPSDDREAKLPAAFELVVDAGSRTFALSGVRTISLERELRAGNNGTWVLSFTADEPEQRPARPVTPAPTDKPATERAQRDYTWPIVAYGVAAAGIGVGAVFGVRALDAEDALAERCPKQRCSASDRDDLDAARRDGWISTIGFGVGVAGAALGTYLLLGGQGEDRTTAVAPAIGLGWAGARGRF